LVAGSIWMPETPETYSITDAWVTLKAVVKVCASAWMAE